MAALLLRWSTSSNKLISVDWAPDGYSCSHESDGKPKYPTHRTQQKNKIWAITGHSSFALMLFVRAENQSWEDVVQQEVLNQGVYFDLSWYPIE
jgi:hypothetical protein